MRPTIDDATHNPRHYKYYDLLMAAFVTVLLCSNLIGPGKSCAIDLGLRIIPDWTTDHGWIWSSLLVFGAGNIFFPIGYIFGDVLTEVYGYARARKVIWAGFGAMIFATIMSFVVIRLPLNHDEPFNKIIQPAIETCFGNTWRIVVFSMLAFWVGDFVNSYVMAKMKVQTGGRFLWMRTIGSTIVGQGIDSLIFYPGAFANLAPLFKALHLGEAGWMHGWENDTLVKTVIFNWIFKVGIEVIMTPATYAICGFLKRAENEDYFDRRTNFTPFSLQD